MNKLMVCVVYLIFAPLHWWDSLRAKKKVTPPLPGPIIVHLAFGDRNPDIETRRARQSELDQRIADEHFQKMVKEWDYLEDAKAEIDEMIDDAERG